MGKQLRSCGHLSPLDQIIRFDPERLHANGTDVDFDATFNQSCQLLYKREIVLKLDISWKRGNVYALDIEEDRYGATFIQRKPGQFHRHVDGLQRLGATGDVQQHGGVVRSRRRPRLWYRRWTATRQPETQYTEHSRSFHRAVSTVGKNWQRQVVAMMVTVSRNPILMGGTSDHQPALY